MLFDCLTLFVLFTQIVYCVFMRFAYMVWVVVCLSLCLYRLHIVVYVFCLYGVYCSIVLYCLCIVLYRLDVEIMWFLCMVCIALLFLLSCIVLDRLYIDFMLFVCMVSIFKCFALSLYSWYFVFMLCLCCMYGCIVFIVCIALI